MNRENLLSCRLKLSGYSPERNVKMADEAKKETGAEKEPRKKKVKDLILKDIEDRLAELKTSQGGWKSRYARHLLDRKKALTSR